MIDLYGMLSTAASYSYIQGIVISWVQKYVSWRDTPVAAGHSQRGLVFLNMDSGIYHGAAADSAQTDRERER